MSKRRKTNSRRRKSAPQHSDDSRSGAVRAYDREPSVVRVPAEDVEIVSAPAEVSDPVDDLLALFKAANKEMAGNAAFSMWGGVLAAGTDERSERLRSPSSETDHAISKK